MVYVEETSYTFKAFFKLIKNENFNYFIGIQNDFYEVKITEFKNDEIQKEFYKFTYIPKRFTKEHDVVCIGPIRNILDPKSNKTIKVLELDNYQLHLLYNAILKKESDSIFKDVNSWLRNEVELENIAKCDKIDYEGELYHEECKY